MNEDRFYEFGPFRVDLEYSWAEPSFARFLTRLASFSRTVKDLVAGSGIRFEDRGGHLLDGVTGEWRRFSVERGGCA